MKKTTPMLVKIRKSFVSKILACYLMLTMVFDIAYPTMTWALTGGPSQPEVSGFQPIDTSDMVDISSGDFKYNIPLMNMDGYALNLTYNGVAGMDAEASWVGLGWNLNPGAVNRS
ncbi:MAG TPA: hypothetical protein VD905_20135, partial [Flavobacteriales bacterium]|nr:hypothetical protein [Flavobacteriales bacterium]